MRFTAYQSRVKVLLGTLTLACFAALAVVAASKKSSYLSKEEADRELQASSVRHVVSFGILHFAQMEGRPPGSLAELCASPHIPVRCTDLINPYTGQPIREKQDSPGDISFEWNTQGYTVRLKWNPSAPYGMEPERVWVPGFTLHAYFLRGGALEDLPEFFEGDARKLTENLVGSYGHSFPLKLEWEGRSPADLAAYAAARYIHSRFFSFMSVAERLAKSLSEIEEWNAALDLTRDWRDFNKLVPFVPKVRNDWTGGYAEVGTSPGNYEYIPGTYPYYEFRMYGEGGVLIARANDRSKTPGPGAPVWEFGNSLIQKTRAGL